MQNSEKSSESGDTHRPWQSYHTAYTNSKAGMDGVDKETVQRIVYEMSKGSKYFENEQRKEAIMRQKIENMRAQCEKLTAADTAHHQMVADRRIVELEAMRDLTRIWLHVDMDAFYAAVETLSNPSLKGKPMAVGSMSMISTANYEARKFGVRAAMPGFIARKLCTGLIFVPTDFEKYTYYSSLTRKVFQEYDSHFMAASLDEAYLDITEVCKERDMTGGEIAEELRNSVHKETGLTCSVGVAPNRLLAKVCSDINKPNGQYILPNDRRAVMTFISSLPIRKIGGIGKVTESILREVFGIKTCEEMLQKGGFLCALFSHSAADFFLSVGLGLGSTDTPEVRSRKSISNERTFSATNDEAILYQKLAEIVDMLSADMQKEGLSGRTLTLKLKTAAFEVRSRALTLQKYICSREDILEYGSKLLKAELPISLRLIGLRVSHFNEDKASTPSDPTQKTITSFIASGDTVRKNARDCRSMSLDILDQHLVNDPEPSFSTDGHDINQPDSRDPLDSNNQQDLVDSCCTLSRIIEVRSVNELSGSKTAEKVNSKNLVGYNQEFNLGRVSQLKEAESTLPCYVEEGSPSFPDKLILDNVAMHSSEQKDQSFWVDDYKCSLCGIEIPVDFVEERQEHSDFHFAERLQKEESSVASGTSTMRQNLVRKDDISNQSKHKKHKPSPKEVRHLPIDTFFVKSNQNF